MNRSMRSGRLNPSNSELLERTSGISSSWMASRINWQVETQTDLLILPFSFFYECFNKNGTNKEIHWYLND